MTLVNVQVYFDGVVRLPHSLGSTALYITRYRQARPDIIPILRHIWSSFHSPELHTGCLPKCSRADSTAQPYGRRVTQPQQTLLSSYARRNNIPASRSRMSRASIALRRRNCIGVRRSPWIYANRYSYAAFLHQLIHRSGRATSLCDSCDF